MVRQDNFPDEIAFSFPHKTAVISLTGNACGLDCAHCGGHYLQSMRPIWDVDASECTSCLISGGCDSTGKVPVLSHLEAIKALRPGRRMNWHVGLIGEEEMNQIAPLVDTISFDFLVDDDTIKEVYGLDKTGEDYISTYELLQSRATVLPHITVGLKGGEMVGEYRALEALEKLEVPGIVFIVFTPTPGTRYADRNPPGYDLVGDLIAEARLIFPKIPLMLGCLRPHGKYRGDLDCMAIKAGVNKIVKPAAPAVAYAKELGLTIVRQEECCVL